MSLELIFDIKNAPLHSVLKTLRSVKNIINYWTITGPPEYKQNVETELIVIPGSYNNTKKNASDYKLVMDEGQELYGGEKLKNFIFTQKKDVYCLKYGSGYNLEDLYYDKCIWSTKNNPVQMQFITDPYIFIQIFDRLNEINKKKNYIKVFEKLKKDKEKGVLQCSINDYCQYLYRAAAANEKIFSKAKAFEYFKELKKIVKNDKGKFLNKQETREYMFTAEYEIIYLSHLFEPHCNNDENTTEKLTKMQEKYPERLETYFKLFSKLYENKQYTEIYQTINHLMSFPKPTLLYTILNTKIYDYYMPYMCIDVNLKVNNIQTAVSILKKTLIKYPFEQPLLNIKYALFAKPDMSKIKKLSSNKCKTMVIHTGCFFYCWNPQTDTKISGSEYMAMNLAKEFAKETYIDEDGSVQPKYNVFLFGWFEDPTMNLDYQDVYDNVQYIDYKCYSGFVATYYIDYLIVSRFTQLLVYNENIENVYLWCHDVGPNSDGQFILFQTHPKKFKGVIALTEWHKKTILNLTGVPDEMVKISRNAIYTERFINTNIEKIPFRFIYMADFERGLNDLIDMIPKIIERYPSSTFVFFTRKDFIPDEYHQKIKTLNEEHNNFISLNDRTSQDNISKELLKSDIWLYPTTFTETYCISCLEAMCAGCLVATVNLAGLGNVVGDRGITIEPNEPWEKLFEKLCEVLDNPEKKQDYITRAMEWSMKQTYTNLVKEWEEMFENDQVQ
jgi:glycosyltransferase involved in cell wall biosynthesis